VAEYLKSLPDEERATVAGALFRIQERGLDEASVTRRQIQGKLWELKITQHRLFYVLILGPEMIVLHAYKKQSQKAPKKEVKVARRGMEVVLRDEEAT